MHNSPRGQERERDAATADEVALVRRLQASGDPVVVVGDTNERTEFFCRVAAATGLAAANGATVDASGCHVPREHRRIDWIMGGGGTHAGLEWRGFSRTQGAEVRRTSDHPLLVATALVTPR